MVAQGVTFDRVACYHAQGAQGILGCYVTFANIRHRQWCLSCFAGRWW